MRAGIRELWVVDVVDRRVIVHREPSGSRYGITRVAHPHERIAPLAFADDEFDVVALTGG